MSSEQAPINPSFPHLHADAFSLLFVLERLTGEKLIVESAVIFPTDIDFRTPQSATVICSGKSNDEMIFVDQAGHDYTSRCSRRSNDSVLNAWTISAALLYQISSAHCNRRCHGLVPGRNNRPVSPTFG